MSNLIVSSTETALEIRDSLARAGLVANHFAAEGVFADYRSRKARNTIARQDDDLARFADFLNAAGTSAGDLSQDVDAWRGVTWGLVEGFVKWQLQQGFAVSSVNVRLSTVKTYARLAMKSGAVSTTEYALIRAVQGYRRTESKRIDEVRETTRVGNKKAEPTTFTRQQATALKKHPDTPQGRRDAVLMGVLLDLGLRVGEVAALKVKDVDVTTGFITFYRPKVNKVQTHGLTKRLWTPFKAYFERGDAPTNPDAPLLRSSNKHGALTTNGMTRFGIMQRVRALGERAGVERLSPHDCRHYWATNAARNGTPIDRLQEAGGWSSPAMPLRYVEAAKIANEGVRVD